jgi:hypothetical protein
LFERDFKFARRILTRRAHGMGQDSPHSFQPSLEKTVTSTAYAPAAASLNNEPIDINKEASLNYWVAALACSELELRVAVAEVGPAAKDVSNELGRVL